jgi:ABC-type transporter Mla MlaB component
MGMDLWCRAWTTVRRLTTNTTWTPCCWGSDYDYARCGYCTVEGKRMTSDGHPGSAAAATMRLGRNTSIREAAAIKQELLTLLDHPETVTVVMSDVEGIDTAVLQLLYAFERDRTHAGRVVAWHGASAGFDAAAATLGLVFGARSIEQP